MQILNLSSPTEMSGFYVIYKGSCHLEKPGERGLSHLMEHLLCKSFEHMFDDFSAYAIDWNAYTSQNEIVFYISGLDEHISRMKDPFLESLGKFDITKQELETEKDIVMSEYLMCFDSTFDGHYLNLWRKYFDFYNPIGHRDDIMAVTMDKCHEFFDRQFMEPTKVINVSKDSPMPGGVNEMAEDEETFPKYSFGNHDDSPIEPFPISDMSESLFMVSDEVPKDKQHLASFSTSLLSMGLNSPFYKIIREEHGLLYNMSLNTTSLGDQHFPIFYTVAPKDNISEIVRLAGEITADPEAHIQFDDFLRMKSLYKNNFKVAEINQYEDVDQHISPEIKKLKDSLQAIKYEECMELISENLDMKNWKVSLGSEIVKS